MRIDDLLVAAHHLAHLVGDLSDLFRIWTNDPELYREADRRPEIEPVDTHARFRQRAIRHRLFQPRLDPLPRFDVLRHDHDLGECFIRQLRIEPQPEPRRAAAHIGGVGRNIVVALEQRFRPFHQLQRRTERGARRHAKLEEKFGPLRQRKELLLHATERHDREHKDANGRDHDNTAPPDAPFDDATQATINPRFVNCVGILARARAV